jgi:hypothetical protein
MKFSKFFIPLLEVGILLGSGSARSQSIEARITNGGANHVSVTTNGPAVFRAYGSNVAPASSIEASSPATHPDAGFSPQRSSGTNLVFDHFLPESLSHAIWTNLLARTNGRTTQIWSTRIHPEGWPAKRPTVKWDTNNLMWGMAGLTALSPCWEREGSSGQAPVTALTRRHGYARGHSMGEPGFHQGMTGKKVWFLDKDSQLAEVKVLREVIRVGAAGDYTLLLFDRDLPPSIEPLQVASFTNVLAKYPPVPNAPRCLLKTEQSGRVSADLPGFTVNTWKAGDSGSPDLLPLGNQLVFTNGRSTSGPTREMQADMDELCRQARLDPKPYQMIWADLSGFPAY